MSQTTGEPGADNQPGADDEQQSTRDLEELRFRELVADLDDSVLPEPDPKPWRRAIAVVVMPIPDSNLARAIMQKSELDFPVVQTRTGAVTFFQVPAGDEIDSLLGNKRPIPEGAQVVAEALSRECQRVILLVSWISEGGEHEPGVRGNIVARRFLWGAEALELPAGLVVASLDPLVEELLLGRIDPEEASTSGNHSSSPWSSIFPWKRARPGSDCD